MYDPIDHTDLSILTMLEDNARQSIWWIAIHAGISEHECARRIVALEDSGHIAGYTIMRSYPDTRTRPLFAVICITQDRNRNGHDLQRSMDSVPEIVSADLVESDGTVLVRVQAPHRDRLNEIVEVFRLQSAVLSLSVSTSTPLLVPRISHSSTSE